MAERRVSLKPPSLLTATAILALFAVGGLLVGLAAHQLAFGNQTSTNHPLNSQTPVISNAPTATPTATTTAPATTAATATTQTTQPTAPAEVGAFTLSVSVTPRGGRAGDTITITAKAVQQGTQTPMVGLQIALTPPDNGEPALLTTFPAPVLTDTNGLATWSVVVPALAPGTYRIDVAATGTHSYHANAFTSFAVTA